MLTSVCVSSRPPQRLPYPSSCAVSVRQRLSPAHHRHCHLVIFAVHSSVNPASKAATPQQVLSKCLLKNEEMNENMGGGHDM